MKTYFYVYRRFNGAPSHKHETLESAVAESKRLAARYPSETFEILQCVALTSAPKPHANTFYLDGVAPVQRHEGFPDGVPLPAIPHEFSKAIYRGYAWLPDCNANYAILAEDFPDVWEYIGYDRPLGVPDSRYCEFVK
jgi:hypothetical protein